jgi:zinc/manganese transport system substrate-binding protein
MTMTTMTTMKTMTRTTLETMTAATRRTLLGAALLGVALWSLTARPAQAKLRVAATIETLADVARQVGGDRVEVESLSRGTQDPHFVPAKPSLVLALNKADVLVQVGLDLEIGWLPPLVQQSRNAKIQAGQPGNVDCSTAIEVRDVPNVAADKIRALGDVHPLGNPHYWLPPDNALAIARLLANRFTAVDAAGGAAYAAGMRAFEQRLRARQAEWTKRAAGLKGMKVVTYHKSWSYVTRWLALDEIGTIEPKPGIPPTANHTAQLITLMKQQGAKLILIETFYPSNLAGVIARETGARVVGLPSDVGATSNIKTYFELGDALLTALGAPK